MREVADGLGVQLADARLGHAEDLADLLERESLVVVQGDDGLLALGQPFDGLGEDVLDLDALEHRDRILGGLVPNRSDGALGVVALAADPQLLERDDRGVGELGENAPGTP